jgi:hypothetical protein
LACVAPDFGCDAKVPTEEFCDLEDNDCDGQTDEDFGTVTCGFGVCEHTVELCAQGQFVQCDPLEGAGVEVCNELDDDCDGSTDEIDDVGTTSCGLGVCLQTVSGCEECDPYAGAVDEEPGMATSCDGLDNDCNGETDDYWPEVGLACDGSDSDSCENGVWTCTENGTGVACAGDDSNSVEICNGFDDDCNGTPDDGLGTTTCGFGICEHTVDNCSNGQDQVCDSMEGAQASDLPDASFQDTNCDGIDGDESRAVFVDGYAGNDSNPGTKTSPVKTLSKALQKASANAKNQVLVSAGSYSGQVVLKNGVGIFGGYNAATGWTRSPGNAVQLVGSSKVVVATNISATTELALLTITASNNTATGGSSYGVFSKNSSGLVLRNCTITGGNGGSGSSGSNGSIGSSGNTGTKGNPGCEDGGSLFCSDCNPPGAGAGASSSCGGSGGNGGLSGKGGFSGKNGGTPSGGGVGGQGGSAGKSGSTGGSAPNASGGSGGSGGNSIGSAGSNGYGSAGGGSGSQGANAKGGGGGGGGGGDDPGFAECNTWGGTGGGGGSGGCGGTGGSGGGGGGGSFGVYIYAGSVSLIDCTVVSMTGGAGGAAGAGGTGGSGGNGGNGGTGGDEDATNGGKGGKGGKGGNGGHGGGGGGGPSIGILCGGGGAVSTSNTSIQTGTAGPAGTSPGNNGKTGKVSNKWGC